MADASISLDQEQYICPVCLELLKDPVTVPCGHCFCKVCINGHWDQENQRRVYSCPQCRETFTPRPVLRRNNMLADVVEKVKKTEEHKAIKSCLSELKEEQRKLQQRLQEKLKKVEEVKQTVDNIKRSAQTAVEDSERIFTELICSIEKKRSEVRKLIRDQEEDEVSRAEGVLEQLEQEIADLKRRDAELVQLSHTEDHTHFLQSFQSLCVSSGSEDSSSISVHQHPSFDGVRKSLSELKESLEEFCRKEFNKFPPHAAASQAILPPEPKSREDFLKYFCRLSLDPNTANDFLVLSEENREVTCSRTNQHHSDHPDRFEFFYQVLCEESVCGRSYWEVERRSVEGCWVGISVSYKGMKRKGRDNECAFGYNSQSWCLYCFSSISFWHNNIQTFISEPPSSRIGVYVDHSAGTLSFYNVSDTMTLLHRVHTTFTHPVYAGFWIDPESVLKLCDPE